MKPFKKEIENRVIERATARERLREYWQCRMRSLSEKKMSRGAANIFRIIKDRFNWGEKDFPRNIKKPKR